MVEGAALKIYDRLSFAFDRSSGICPVPVILRDIDTMDTCFLPRLACARNRTWLRIVVRPGVRCMFKAQCCHRLTQSVDRVSAASDAGVN